MEIITLTLGSLQTNCYLVSCPQTQEAIIIDPADAGGFISEEIIKNKLKPKFIILTHAHFDHVLGLLELKLNFPVPILVHPDDLFLLKKTPDSAQYWLKRKVDPVPLPDENLEPNQIIKFGHQAVQVIHTPGHTPGSVSLYSAQNQLCFTGDTLFKEAVGRTDFSYSDPQSLKKSLHQLVKLPRQTILYPGHGPQTTISHEKELLF